MALLWAPMMLVIPQLPDLGSQREVARFLSEEGDTLRVVLVSVSVGYLPLLAFLAGVAERLRCAVGGRLAWLFMGAALMFMTALNVALGLDAAAALLLETAGPGSAYTLHGAAFVLAAPAAFAGVALFAALLAAASRGALAAWLGWVALAGVVANIGAVGGVLTLTGPFNSGNGLVAGIALPVGLWIGWVVLASVTWVSSEAGN